MKRLLTVLMSFANWTIYKFEWLRFENIKYIFITYELFIETKSEKFNSEILMRNSSVVSSEGTGFPC